MTSTSNAVSREILLDIRQFSKDTPDKAINATTGKTSEE